MKMCCDKTAYNIDNLWSYQPSPLPSQDTLSTQSICQHSTFHPVAWKRNLSKSNRNDWPAQRCHREAVLTFDPFSTVQLDLSLSLGCVGLYHDEGAPGHGAVEFPFGPAGAGECVWEHSGRRADIPLHRPRAVNKNIGYRGDARQLVAKCGGHWHGPVKYERACVATHTHKQVRPHTRLVCAGPLLNSPGPARPSCKSSLLISRSFPPPPFSSSSSSPLLPLPHTR